MKEDFWVLESADSEEGPWTRWMIPKTLMSVAPTTFDECMRIVEEREARKKENDKKMAGRGILRVQPLRPFEKTFIRVRNIWTEETVPLWALDDDFK